MFHAAVAHLPETWVIWTLGILGWEMHLLENVKAISRSNLGWEDPGEQCQGGCWIKQRAPPLWLYLTLITSQRCHLEITEHWELGLQHLNFGGIQTSSHDSDIFQGKPLSKRQMSFKRERKRDTQREGKIERLTFAFYNEERL